MQVQHIVQASAEVLTITRLRAGDVYKRVEETAYSSSTATLRFGVVQGVMNNGQDAAVTALEYEADYGSGIKATVKVFTGNQPAAIYPATPEEVTAHIDDLHRATEREVRRAEEDLAKKRAALEAVVDLRSRVGTLTAPETSRVLLAGESTEETPPTETF